MHGISLEDIYNMIDNTTLQSSLHARGNKKGGQTNNYIQIHIIHQNP